MDLFVFRPLWGVATPLRDALPAFRAQGYRGVEAPLPDVAHASGFKALVREHDLEYIPLIFTSDLGDGAPNFKAHLDSFQRELDVALTFAPTLVNVHAGVDHWSEREADAFFAGALDVERNAPVPVAFETHRGRTLFTPWATRRLVETFPDLRLTADFSHWVCVCERLLDDQLDTFHRIAPHVVHIHARVGFEEGPQVSDPRAPEFDLHLKTHERWWTLVWEAQRARGAQRSTLTPEFGPPPYQPVLPYTRAPVAPLADICDWMANRQAERFANFERARIP
ncbi:sugar phosphate isomerase/epimerase family protein [Deinococcus yavapaiensis]|uniref:Xylose isomerase-like TIM barrel protein n=1 Tax=Deinococcus yavapaiensis KR-236 TaxID=694435 RepID=A0A318S3C6_9DEIO|nr:sugar phosphate isomerase/epimerase [Deinococcus yavapaiensis]PYE50519.1 xylose isomerase-like TIM barrel protein [Deinococcus yavapaiensis KR-236]